ncbi:MAG: ARMT1-like domain-containing protein [Bacteroidales bacterium]|nr:ARMT1-like domain-containing protein [Bacteroidales bacterium]
MISDYRCFYCLTRSFEKLLEKGDFSSGTKSCFTRDMIRLYDNYWDQLTFPEFARELHNILRIHTHIQDPYIEEKKNCNSMILNNYSEIKQIVNQSADPFGSALRFAIAGNILDYVVNDSSNLTVNISSAVNTQFAIDNSSLLKENLGKAKMVLYLGDNAGEIVFDKLFIETINHPNLIYAVRGAPVVNDATMEDAEYTGLTNIVKVISNGYDAPSTILNKSDSIFQQYFKEADLIISKGQGNLEGLLHLNDNRIFFLLMAKCNVIAEFLKVNKGSFVVYNPAS